VAVGRVSRAAAEKVHRTDPDGDIPDPIGGGVSVYRKIAAKLRRVLRNVLEEKVL
jgi:hypothetical protein